MRKENGEVHSIASPGLGFLATVIRLRHMVSAIRYTSLQFLHSVLRNTGADHSNVNERKHKD